MEKYCRGCGTNKPLVDFSISKRGKFGRAFYCRTCSAERAQALRDRKSSPSERARVAAVRRDYLARNPKQRELQRQRSAERAVTHAVQAYERVAAWRAAHTEQSRAHTAKWREEHPAAARMHVERRRARLQGAEVNDLTVAQWKQVVAEFNNCCAYCLQPSDALQQEHMTPLSRGGSHSMSNIVPACSKCNGRKGVRNLLEFLAYETKVS